MLRGKAMTHDQDMEYTKAPAANLATAAGLWKLTKWTSLGVALVLAIMAATLV